MNKIILNGIVLVKPELSQVGENVVTTIRIAVKRKYSKNDEEDYFNIKAWRGLAENCVKYIDVGSRILVSGTLQSQSYEDKSGVKKTSFFILAEDVEFLSSPKKDKEKDLESRCKVEEPKDLPF